MAQKKYSCIVPGCDREFDNPWGVRVHCVRSHKDLVWHEEWTQLVKDRGKLSTSSISSVPSSVVNSTSKSGSKMSSEKYLATMIKALQRAPSNQLAMPDLISKIRAVGDADHSDRVMRTRISSIVRQHPQSRIKRVSRGVYALAQSSEPFEDENIPSEVGEADIEILRRQSQRKADAILGLMRIITMLIED
jgi:hypothetical protein